MPIKYGLDLLFSLNYLQKKCKNVEQCPTTYIPHLKRGNAKVKTTIKEKILMKNYE